MKFLPIIFLSGVVALQAIAALPPITPDHPEALAAGITKAARVGAGKIVIPPGVYRLPRPENSEWLIELKGLKNLEIEATGVTFLIECRDKRPLLFNHCENVTLRGLTIERETPPFSQGKIEAIANDRGSVDIRIDQGYPTDLDDPRYFSSVPVIDVYKPGTRELKPLVPDIYIARIERLGPDLFRFYGRSKIDPKIPITPGDPAAWRSPWGSSVNLWDTACMKLENVTIRNGKGISFMELSGEGGNQYLNCRVTYGSKPKGATEEPLLSSSTDGFHSALMRHGPTLDQCLFEGMNDDGTNIHGSYAMLVETDGNKAIVDWRNPHSGGGPRPLGLPGDTLHFYNRKGTLLDEAKVISYQPRPDYPGKDIGPIDSRVFSRRDQAEYGEVILDHSINGVPGGMVANQSTNGNGFVIRNCTYRNHRGHGIFLRASDGVIENCTLEGIMMGGIVVAPELNSWNESDYASNVIIRGNTLRNVGLGTQPWNSGITVAAYEFGGFVPRPGGHRNIVIRDNTLENNRGANIVVTSAIGVEIQGNRFINPMTEPPFRVESIGTSNDGALIWVRESEKVSLSGNTILNPGPYFNCLVDADDSVKDKDHAFLQGTK